MGYVLLLADLAEDVDVEDVRRQNIEFDRWRKSVKGVERRLLAIVKKRTFCCEGGGDQIPDWDLICEVRL